MHYQKNTEYKTTMKCSVYIATSVDGFIAKKDGDIEWLHHPMYEKGAFTGLSYETYIKSVDAIVMGCNSYEKVRTFGFWPYEYLPVILLTHQPIALPKALEGKVQIENLSPHKLLCKLQAQGYQHLYIDGGETIQSFLNAGLIEEMTITSIPILLGAGIPLFGALDHPVSLRLLDAFSMENGFVQIRYQVDYPQTPKTNSYS